MLVHLSAGHVTLLPGEFHPPKFSPRSNLGRRANSRWALSQIYSWCLYFVKSHARDKSKSPWSGCQHKQTCCKTGRQPRFMTRFVTVPPNGNWTLAFNQTPIYTATTQIWGSCILLCACLHPIFCWYSLHLPMDGWPDWVEWVIGLLIWK